MPDVFDQILDYTVKGPGAPGPDTVNHADPDPLNTVISPLGEPENTVKETVISTPPASPAPEETITYARGRGRPPKQIRKRSLSALIRTADERRFERVPNGYSEGAAEVPKPYKNSAGHFLPGHKGGPGRPVGFGSWAKLARYLTGDGLEIMAFALGVLRGEVTHIQFHPKTGEEVTMEASPALKWEIAKWLAAQGFGREISRMEVSGPDGGPIVTADATEEPAPDLSQLTTEEVRQYLELRMKAMRGRPASEQTVEAAPAAPGGQGPGSGG